LTQGFQGKIKDFEAVEALFQGKIKDFKDPFKEANQGF